MAGLSKHLALVTGGSRGIGRSIALSLARAGARVAVNYLANEKAAEQVVAEINHLGSQAVAVRGDVSQKEEVAEMVEQIHRILGAIDILVNNAGIGDPYYQDVVSVKEELWDKIQAVNLKGTFLVCQSVLPDMLSKKWGRIVNISSTSGITGGTSGVHYAAAKGGVIAFSKALAQELAPAGITVNVVAPSKIDTDLFHLVTPPGKEEEVIKKIPVGRLGTPQDVAEAVLFFAREEASFVTGQTLVVSGGY
ncbi:MAG: 3-oxoacyl-[acyl-carrier protein] reductase [Candidatus Atribacteria bacterium]|nr:3-oxoacyl-[acyl-carrier protein] reductase [Candidatus Atribacteria bacterium]